MKKKDTRKKAYYNDSDNGSRLTDFGLEPPKRYRDSQRVTDENNIKKEQHRDKDNLTRTQKRELQAKKRRKKNKIRKILIWLLLAIFLICVAVVLSLTVLFPINTVTVTGCERYTAEEIISECTIETGENLFLADTESAEERIEKNLPYVYNAEITRKLPSTIEITVTEAEPSYCISNEDEAYILLDSSFKVLETNAEEASGIEIQNVSASSVSEGSVIEIEDENVFECLSEMAQAIEDNDITEITAIYSNNLSDNCLVYENRITLEIGSCENIESKLYQALAACEQLNESSPNAKGTMTYDSDKQMHFTEE